MKLHLSDLKYYYLTVRKKDNYRKEHLLKEFKELNLHEVNPIMKIGKLRSGASGFSKILDLACVNQDRSKPFQPFAILEDDVKKNREFPLDIEIPDDADILYIGISKCGMDTRGCCHTVCFKNINEDIIRVYNMLSTHGMIICSVRGLLTLQKCLIEGYSKNIQYDIIPSQIQPYINVYALKNPLVYQYEKIGGLEEETKINYSNLEDKVIPQEWINTKHISILTTYKE